MPLPPDSPITKKIGDTLRYFEDLGIVSFYLDRRSSLSLSTLEPAGRSAQSTTSAPVTMAPATISLGVVRGPTLFEAALRVEGDSLERILSDLGDCRRCRLCEGRSNIVFGDGSAKAQLVFVGEGPGHDEDVQGLPFVGRAGKLLNQMIEAMGLRRTDVYICNVVKCRPPGNRAPEKDEMATCSPFLLRQLEVISPKVIVCLGAVASKALLQTEKGISQFRGQWLDFRGIPLMATYHPAYLLRNPHAKSDVWKDLQKVMATLGLPTKKAPRP
jgi:DNA polymerase